MSGQAATRQVIVTHPHGIVLRPSYAIVQTVGRFQSKVQIRHGDQEADARWGLEIVSLAVPCGAEVTLSAQGPNADEVLDALVTLFADDFGMPRE
jgi:phosphotransferase system HPr (HPr) family protein